SWRKPTSTSGYSSSSGWRSWPSSPGSHGWEDEVERLLRDRSRRDPSVQSTGKRHLISERLAGGGLWLRCATWVGRASWRPERIVETGQAGEHEGPRDQQHDGGREHGEFPTRAAAGPREGQRRGARPPEAVGRRSAAGGG